MIDEHQLDWAIFDTVANLIVVLDSQGRVVKFNRACERLSGRANERGRCAG
jgi:PAS domain S-box-containing protein